MWAEKKSSEERGIRKGIVVGYLRLSLGTYLARVERGLFDWQVRPNYFRADWRVPRVVLVTDHLKVRACSGVLSLGGYSWTEQKRSVTVLSPSGLRWAYSFYVMYPVADIIMIVSILWEHTTYSVSLSRYLWLIRYFSLSGKVL